MGRRRTYISSARSVVALHSEVVAFSPGSRPQVVASPLGGRLHRTGAPRMHQFCEIAHVPFFQQWSRRSRSEPASLTSLSEEGADGSAPHIHQFCEVREREIERGRGRERERGREQETDREREQREKLLQQIASRPGPCRAFSNMRSHNRRTHTLD